MTPPTGDLARSLSSDAPVPAIDEDRFELLEEIGTGGMGSVYRAVQRSVGRYVAVKMLLPEHAASATGLSRFVREANVIARLTHPNIVQLIDFGRDRQGNLMLVMELLEGEPLRTLLRREGRLAPERAVAIAAQVLQALKAAHAAGVIHRDLKPENVFVRRADEVDHVKVLDFGVAKLTETDAADTHQTSQGTMVGTLRYMAPEQVAGEPADPRIDVYACGVTLYEMLSGALPYDARDRYVLLRQIIAEPPTPLVARAPDVPPPLAEVVMRAIAKAPADRFASVDEFRRALAPFVGGDAARWSVSGESVARSGVVRSAVVPLPAAPMPAAAVPTPVAPKRSAGLVVLVGSLFVGTVIAGALVFHPVSPPPVAAAPAHAVAPVAPVAMPPEPAPPPHRPSHLVVVQSTPPGAVVTDPSGAVLCPSTPCAVPVPAGSSRSVVLTLGSARLPVVLEPSATSASVDLGALVAAVPAPAPTAAAAPRPPPTPRTRPRRHDDGTSDPPMFLPP